MNRKILYLFTFILFYLSNVTAVKAQCLVEGTSSDGIVITDVKLDSAYRQLTNVNTIQLETKNSRSVLSFSITVPAGKTASLSYKLFLEIYASKSGGKLPKQSNLSFTVRCDGHIAIDHSDPEMILAQLDRVEITEGKHYIEIETRFSAKKCNIAGSIDNLSIHVHQFGKMQVSREPICGQDGESYATCDVCGKDSTITIAPRYKEHSMVVRSGTEASCMSNAGSVSVCEHCPYAEITYTYDVKEHDFDADGVCRVCHLRKPRASADGSVYDIYYASEMHVLSEMVGLGRIPGNIGVNIHSDLVFDKDTTMVPLGTFDNPFQGVLNGNGHRIRGIVYSYQGFNCLGFVGVAKGTLLKNAVIANLIFDSGNTLRGKSCVGGIVGYASNCDIVNCASFGALEGTDNVGGIVGYADRQVSIQNCGSVAGIRSYGLWNTMVCGMPLGHIMNSYGASTNVLDGAVDELPTTTLRHCFSTQASGPGLTQVSHDVLTSYAMVQLLNAESESPCFEKSQDDHYPVPVVNTAIQAKANSAIQTKRSAVMWRAASAALGDEGDDSDDEGEEDEVTGGYVDENSPSALGHTIEEVLRDDSVQYADFERLYVVTRSAPEGFNVYDEITGGQTLAFESYILPADSSYFKMTEYDVSSSSNVIAKTETMCVYTGDKKRIDEYTIGRDGTPSLTSRISFKNNYDIVYQENVDGVLKPVWSLETKYDETTGNATYTNGYSYDRITGETHLEFSSTYDSEDLDDDTEEESYFEYWDEFTNTIHIMYYYIDPADDVTPCREHFILRATDEYLMEIRIEKVINGRLVLTDGLYFIYDNDGSLAQSVAFGPADDNSPESSLRPYRYYEYYGYWQANTYPTAIKVPTVEQSSLKNRIDPNVYDMQGRVVRRVTDTKDPFSGLPNGLYIYQGMKYIKR